MPAWRNKLHTHLALVISHLQCCIKLFWLRALSFLFWSANKYKFIHQNKTYWSSWRTSYNHTHSNEKLSISQTTCSPSIHRSYITWTELPDTIQTWFDTPFILWIKHSGLKILCYGHSKGAVQASFFATSLSLVPRPRASLIIHFNALIKVVMRRVILIQSLMRSHTYLLMSHAKNTWSSVSSSLLQRSHIPVVSRKVMQCSL